MTCKNAQTNNANPETRMFINSDGNVGIGTNDPKQILHIGTGNDSLRIGAVNYQGTTHDTTTYGLERSRNQILFSTYRDNTPDKIGSKIVGINKQTYVGGNVRHLNQSADLVFFTVPPDRTNYDDTIERLRITDIGFIGVGIPSVGTDRTPISKFTINSNYGDGDIGGFAINAYDGSSYSLRLFPFVQSPGQVAYLFKTYNQGIGFDSMCIGYNGNVGIGIINPLSSLDISRTPARTGTHGSGLGLYVTNGGNTIAEFRDPNGTQGIGIGYNRIYSTGSNPNQDIYIESRGTGIIGLLNPTTLSSTLSNRLTTLHLESPQAGILLNSSQSINGKKYNIWSTNEGDSKGAGHLVFYDETSGNYRMLIGSNGNIEMYNNLSVTGSFQCGSFSTSSLQSSSLSVVNGAVWDHMRLWHDGSSAFIDAGGAEDGVAIRVSTTNLSFPSPSYSEILRAKTTGLSVNATGGAVVNVSVPIDSTNFIYLHTNDVAGRMFIGMDNSSGSGLFGGGNPYCCWVGTPNATPLAFATSNTERMRIGSDGSITVSGNQLNYGILRTYGNGLGGPSIIYSENANSGDAYAVMHIRNNTATGAYWFINSSGRVADGGPNTCTLRNDTGALRLQSYGLGLTINTDGSVSHSAGDSSIIGFGPNTSWSGYLRIGAGQSGVTANTSQVISTNGNLHLDAGTGKDVYINHYSSNLGNDLSQAGNIYSYSSSSWFHYGKMCIRGSDQTATLNLMNPNGSYTHFGHSNNWNYIRGINTRIDTNVVINGNLTHLGTDILLTNTSRGAGGRALVHEPSNVLCINYENDFDHVKINSNLKINSPSLTPVLTFETSTVDNKYIFCSNEHISMTANWTPSGTIPNTGRGSSQITLFSPQSGGIIQFNTSSSVNSITQERMRISASGNIGIGTNDPLQGKLQVAGRVMIGYIPNSKKGILIDNEDAYGTNPAIQAVSNILGVSNLSINPSGGNVGIGTIDPKCSFYNYGSGTVGWKGMSYFGNENTGVVVGTYSNEAHIGGHNGLLNGWTNINICPQGSCGIGAINTSYKLNVSGSTQIIGNLVTNGTTYNNGRIVVQNVVDGGSNRGIFMWDAGDSNWGIYMASSGSGRSLAGGVSTAGDGFSQHSIRFRVANSLTTGFIFENSVESRLLSIRGSDGYASFIGNITSLGDITSFYDASDIRLKKNINLLSSSLNVVNSLKPVTFTWKDDIYNIEHRNKDDVGFIAQEVEEVIPFAVGEFSIEQNKYKKINHERIIPYVVKSIQELSVIVDDLQIENNQLKVENNQLKENVNKVLVWAKSQGFNL